MRPPFWLVGDCLLTVSSRDFSSVPTWREREKGVSAVLSYKDTSPTGLGPHSYELTYFNYLTKGPVSEYSHTEGFDILEGTQFSP